MHSAMLQTLLAICLASAVSALHIALPLARALQVSCGPDSYCSPTPENPYPPGTTTYETLSTTSTTVVATTTFSLSPSSSPPTVTSEINTPPPDAAPPGSSIYRTPGIESTVSTATATATFDASSTPPASISITFITSCTHWVVAQLPPPTVTSSIWTSTSRVYSTSCDIFPLTTTTPNTSDTAVTRHPPGICTAATASTSTFNTTTMPTTPTTTAVASTSSGVNYPSDSRTGISSSATPEISNKTFTGAAAGARRTTVSTLMALMAYEALQIVLL